MESYVVINTNDEGKPVHEVRTFFLEGSKFSVYYIIYT